MDARERAEHALRLLPFTPEAKEQYIESVEIEFDKLYRLISELVETAEINSVSTHEVDNMALRALAKAAQCKGWRC